MDLNRTNTNRYLCAAAYLDKSFRDWVIQEIIEEEYKAISISHGIDLVTVVKCCFDARRRENTRNSLLGILFILAVLFEIASNQSQYNTEDPLLLIIIFIIRLFCSPWFVIACVVVTTDNLITFYKIIINNFSKGKYNPENLKIRVSDNIQQRLTELSKEQSGNVIIYSGLSPFVGYGINLGGWSFALNVSKVKEVTDQTLKPISFQVEELYENVGDAIKNLNLDGLNIKEVLCVNGREIRDDPRFLPDPLKRPSPQVTPSAIKHFCRENTKHIRYYKCIQISNWNEEITLSIFLRFVKMKKNLFAEANYFIITPIKTRYRTIDFIGPNINWRRILQIGRDSIINSLFIWPFSPFVIYSNFTKSWQARKERKKLRRLVIENPNFDYGASNSIREIVSSAEYYSYFYELDKQMYVKIIEREILDSLINFLDSKNIDTSELQERQTTILNNGVIVSGGSINTQTFAVGEKAKAVFNNMIQNPVMPKREGSQQKDIS